MSEHPPGLVAVPTLDWIYTLPAISLQKVSHRLPPECGWTWLTGNSKSIAAKRNEAVKMVLEGDPQWLLFLDSDLIFPEGVVGRLLQVDADVACGLYTCKTREEGYQAEAARATNVPADAPTSRPTDHPEFRHEPLDLRRVAQDAGLVDVDMAGAGCMMVHRPVLEALDPPLFVANRDHGLSFGEDWNFCLRARREGFSVTVDAELQCHHVGAKGIGVAEALGWQAVTGQRPGSGGRKSSRPHRGD